MYDDTHCKKIYFLDAKHIHVQIVSDAIIRHINYYCNGDVNVAWCCGFYPAKSLNGPSSRILNGPGTKSWLFEGPKKSALLYLLLFDGCEDSNGSNIRGVFVTSVVPWLRRFQRQQYKSGLLYFLLYHGCEDSNGSNIRVVFFTSYCSMVAKIPTAAI